MAEVSIIVPIYNVEKYLLRCLQSLQAQTLQEIEIILVDDGSPDDCPALCDQLAGEDSRIKVIHKQNGGLSSARNAGLAIATGRYVGFVDADDTAAPEMFETLLQVISREQADFVMSDYIRVLSSGESFLKSANIREGRYDKSDIRREIYPSLIMGENIDYGPLLSVCHCLYDLNFLWAHNLRFDKNVRWSEDHIFSAMVGYWADCFYYLKHVGLYYYYQNSGTITTSYRANAWETYCTMNQHLCSFFANTPDFDFSRQLKLHLIYYACVCIGQTNYLPTSEKIKEIKHILFSNELTSSFSKVFPKNVNFKIRLQLLLMKYKCYRVLAHFFIRRK